MLYNIKNTWVKICIYDKNFYFLFNIKNYPLLSQAMGNKYMKETIIVYRESNNYFKGLIYFS
jgi:hypothetical protein